MQCVATTKSGAQCRREADSDSPTCFSHRENPAPSSPRRREPPDFYAASFTKEQRKAYAQASQIEGQTQETSVLRMLIREAAADGRNNEARLLIAELSRLVRAQKSLGEGADQIGAWIDQALDIVDAGGPRP